MAKIMLVEDDINLREIYAARLLAQGYEVVTASDGEEALATAVKETPDLIVLDVMMPKISGFDVLDILRSTPETKQSKVIMMTALSQQSDRERGERLGADRYLVKSQVTLEDVVNTVDELLNPDKTLQAPVVPVDISVSADGDDLADAGNAPSSSTTTDDAVSGPTPPVPDDSSPPSEPDVATAQQDDSALDEPVEPADHDETNPVEPLPDTGSGPIAADDTPSEPSTEKKPVEQPEDDTSRLEDAVPLSPETTSENGTQAGSTEKPGKASVPEVQVDVPESGTSKAASEPVPDLNTPAPETEPADAPSEPPTTSTPVVETEVPPSVAPQPTDTLTIHKPPVAPEVEPLESPLPVVAPEEPAPVGTTADIGKLPVPELDETLAQDTLTPLGNNPQIMLPNGSVAAMSEAATNVAPDELSTSPVTPPQGTSAQEETDGTNSPSVIGPSLPNEPPTPTAAPINSSNPQPGETIVPTNASN